MKIESTDRKLMFSILWIFVLMNYIYCDILTLMDSTVLKELLKGTVNGMELNENFLLGSGILMEIPIAMILLSKILNHKTNRVTNIISGLIMSIVQIITLFVGTPSKYYLFHSIIEIGTTVFIVWYAVNWKVIQKSTD